MALCSAMKRLGEGSQLEEEVANLQKQQGEFMGKAAEKQSTLESLLALWQRYNKQQYVPMYVHFSRKLDHVLNKLNLAVYLSGRNRQILGNKEKKQLCVILIHAVKLNIPALFSNLLNISPY